MRITLDFAAILSQWPLLFKGVAWTLGLTAVSAVVGCIVGAACAWARSQGPLWLRAVVVKARHADDASARRGEVVFGADADVAREVREHGVRYAVDLRMNRDCSLYLDTRHLRRWLLEHVRGRSVLNTFAYTGSLGVAALARPARAGRPVAAACVVGGVAFAMSAWFYAGHWLAYGSAFVTPNDWYGGFAHPPGVRTVADFVWFAPAVFVADAWETILPTSTSWASDSCWRTVKRSSEMVCCCWSACVITELRFESATSLSVPLIDLSRSTFACVARAESSRSAIAFSCASS